MQSDRKNKSVLESAAEWVDAGPYEPWFRDREKLIRKALGDSYPARNIKRLIRKLVVDVASRDEEFRVELGKDLAELGKGKFHRPNIYPKYFRMMVVSEMRFWKDGGVIKNLPEGYAKSAELHRSEFPELTEDAIRGIYQRELAAQKRHKTP